MTLTQSAVSSDMDRDIGGHIYFIQTGQFIKIGWSRNFDRRIAHMRGHNPLEVTLVGILEGDRKQERILHREFSALHVRGEWFRLEGALKEYIERRTALRLWSMSAAARAYAAAFAKDEDAT